MTTETDLINNMMAHGAQEAVNHASACGVTFDYSIESIQLVEQAMAQLHNSMPKGLLGKLFKRGPSEADFIRTTITMGAYIGEVIRRAHGGYWCEGSEVLDDKTVFTLKLDHSAGEIWPIMKVQKRLVLGPEDNLWQYAQSVTNTIKEARD
jgi:hypothetical protein